MSDTAWMVVLAILLLGFISLMVFDWGKVFDWFDDWKKNRERNQAHNRKRAPAAFSVQEATETDAKEAELAAYLGQYLELYRDIERRLPDLPEGGALVYKIQELTTEKARENVAEAIRNARFYGGAFPGAHKLKVSVYNGELWIRVGKD